MRRVKAGTMSQAALAAHDYVLDIFPVPTGSKAGQPQGKVAV
jgi:hypothetical protein